MKKLFITFMILTSSTVFAGSLRVPGFSSMAYEKLEIALLSGLENRIGVTAVEVFDIDNTLKESVLLTPLRLIGKAKYKDINHFHKKEILIQLDAVIKNEVITEMECMGTLMEKSERLVIRYCKSYDEKISTKYGMSINFSRLGVYKRI
jgi:hypothetical protein